MHDIISLGTTVCVTDLVIVCDRPRLVSDTKAMVRTARWNSFGFTQTRVRHSACVVESCLIWLYFVLVLYGTDGSESLLPLVALL